MCYYKTVPHTMCLILEKVNAVIKVKIGGDIFVSTVGKIMRYLQHDNLVTASCDRLNSQTVAMMMSLLCADAWK